jgi:serine phosphatase RsbU (regulator of sigma subunit)
LPPGPFIAIAPDAAYQDAATSLALGDCFLAFTDGVTEGGAKSGIPQFQHGGLQALLRGLPATATPPAIVSALIRALGKHVGASWPDDDVTVFSLRRR